MKHCKFITSRRLIIAIALIVATVLPSAAQFRFGPRIGVQVNKLKFDNDHFNSDNCSGFAGGLQIEFTVPVIGVGMDASLMYVRRDISYEAEYAGSDSHTQTVSVNKKREYIDIPVNLKYKLSIPVIANIIKPYVFTGPDFAFLTSGRGLSQAYKSKKFDLSWNFGLGVELINHLQISANYGLGLSKNTEMYNEAGDQALNKDSHSRTWLVTAAWLF